MKLTTKLCGAVGALALSGVFATGVGIWSIQKLGAELKAATTATAIKLELVNAAQAASWQLVARLRGMFVNSTLKNTPEMEFNAERADAALQQAKELSVKIRALLATPEGRQSLTRFDNALAEFEKVAADYKRLCREHHIEGVLNLSPAVKKFVAEADGSLQFIEHQNRDFLKNAQDRAAGLQTEALWISFILGILLVSVAAAAIIFVLGIARTLAKSIVELNSGAEHVAVSANQVSASSQDLSAAAARHSSSIEQTSASSEEIASMARRNSENSTEVAKLVASNQLHFDDANQSLEETVQAMAEISAQSGKISGIIKTIDEIAFQTNILALNAAVEAARAGDAGLGFAVVADEVRNLAQRSAEAAKNTASLIEESISKSNAGKAKVDRIADSIRLITAESSRIKTLVDDVNLGSQEQALGIAQIGKAIVQMEHVTQQAALNSERGSAAATQLNSQADRLKNVVDQLNAMVNGAHSLQSH